MQDVDIEKWQGEQASRAIGDIVGKQLNHANETGIKRLTAQLFNRMLWCKI